jgi:hypothetical protein
VNPKRPGFRWWTDEWGLVHQLEAHGTAGDPDFERLPLSLAREQTALRRHIEKWNVPVWDIIGWTSVAEGPWRPRRLVVLMPTAPSGAEPEVLCLDGPRDSPHRFGRRSVHLCLYYPGDPEERRWSVSDGLIRLFDLARRHLMCEHLWRAHGRRARDWPVAQAPHDVTRPATSDPSRQLAPELPLTARGTPLVEAV